MPSSCRMGLPNRNIAMTPVPKINILAQIAIIQPTGPTTAEAHIRYQYQCVRRRCRGARSGHDQRVFYFQWNGSQWTCVRMGPHMSARF